jgi:hypothetical protein
MPRRRYEPAGGQYERIEPPSARGRGARMPMQRSPEGRERHLLGQGAPALPDVTCRSGAATGGRSTTGSGAGPKTAPSSQSSGTCMASSTPKDLSTGASSTWTARSQGPPGPIRPPTLRYAPRSFRALAPPFSRWFDACHKAAYVTANNVEIPDKYRRDAGGNQQTGRPVHSRSRMNGPDPRAPRPDL